MLYFPLCLLWHWKTHPFFKSHVKPGGQIDVVPVLCFARYHFWYSCRRSCPLLPFFAQKQGFPYFMKRCNTREMGNKRHMTLLQISGRLCCSFIFWEGGWEENHFYPFLSLCDTVWSWCMVYMRQLRNGSLEGQSISQAVTMLWPRTV